MNKKMLISIALLFMMILNCIAPVIAFTDEAANGDVEITLNSNLYEAVKRSLMEQEIIASYNDAQRTITMSKNDVVNVTKLNLSNSEIDDLEGLDVFSSLTNVDLSANKLTKDSSLEVLSNMPLTYLDLSSNEIEDISGISNFDTIIETNLHNQEFRHVEILTVTDPEKGDEYDEVISEVTVQLPQILQHAGTFESDWLIEEITMQDPDGKDNIPNTADDDDLRINWSSFDPDTLDLTFVTGSEYGAYEGMIKFTIKITDPHNNLYNSKIDLFYVVVTGVQRGVIFEDENLYEAVKNQLEQDQEINSEIEVYTDEETLYDAAYDEPMVLVIPIDTIVNKIIALQLDNYQIEDLTGIEKFVGLKEKLDFSYNYVDTLEKVFALIDEKLIEEDILQIKFKHKVDKAKEDATKIKAQLKVIEDAEKQLRENAQTLANNREEITRLTDEIVDLKEELADSENRLGLADAKVNLEVANELKEAMDTVERLQSELVDLNVKKAQILAGSQSTDDIDDLIEVKEEEIDTAKAAVEDAKNKFDLQNITIDDQKITVKDITIEELNKVISSIKKQIEELEKDTTLVAKKAAITEAENTIKKLESDNVKLADTSDLDKKIVEAEENIAKLKGDFLIKMYNKTEDGIDGVLQVYEDIFKFSSILTLEVEDLVYDEEYKKVPIEKRRATYYAQISKIQKMKDTFTDAEKEMVRIALGIPTEDYDENGKLVEDPFEYNLQKMLSDKEVSAGKIRDTFKALEEVNEAIKAMNYCTNKRYVTNTTNCYINEYYAKNRNEMLELSFALMEFEKKNYEGYEAFEEAKINYLKERIQDYFRYVGYRCNGVISDSNDQILEDLVNTLLEIANATGEEFEEYVSINALERLNAEENCIQDAEGLEKLNELIELNLRDNEIVIINCVDWAQFTELELLDLGENAISKYDSLNNLTRIEELYLDNNLIEGKVELKVSGYEFIQVVDFSENKITDISNIKTQYIFIARDHGYDSVSDFITAPYTVKIYFYNQVLKMDVVLSEGDSIVYVELPLIFRQIEELDPRPTSFGLYSAIGNITNDGKNVMLDVTSIGDRRAYVRIDSSERYGLSLGDGTMCYIDYVVEESPEIENVVENTTENTIENTVENVVDNTIENTVNNTVDNTVNNTVDNTVDNTVNNTVDNTVNNTVSNLGYKTKGDAIVGVSPDTELESFIDKLTKEYTVVVKTVDGEEVEDGEVGTGMLVVLYDELNTAVAVYELVVTGDANGDGTADAIDSRLIKAHRAEVKMLEDIYSMAADIDGDGDVTAIDSRLLLYHRAEVEGYIL